MAGESIKLRTALKGDLLTVRALLRHPMEVGRRRGADGASVPAHFITRVTCTLDGEVVLDAEWGGGIARDPYLSFEVAGAAAGQVLKLAWEDNQQGHDEASTTL